ncbi:MAG: LysR family transcriptional regulator, partial [Parasporobacterium sp.]|nr:LysR family transcriptional regulator [Parasporobacterium sp.]
MDTEKYRILLKTIQTGSLSDAADELGYTPSGVSRAISAL